jgi:hypothetical protein
MQPAKSVNDQVSGTKVEMIGVAEDDSGASLFKHLLGERFDGAQCAYRHESGSVE